MSTQDTLRLLDRLELPHPPPPNPGRLVALLCPIILILLRTVDCLKDQLSFPEDTHQLLRHPDPQLADGVGNCIWRVSVAFVGIHPPILAILAIPYRLLAIHQEPQASQYHEFRQQLLPLLSQPSNAQPAQITSAWHNQSQHRYRPLHWAQKWSQTQHTTKLHAGGKYFAPAVQPEYPVVAEPPGKGNKG